ncbi:YHS domain-containing protein [Caldivirga sp.]|uniref:YHS domain-containing protein n=1 Tax=Caldivirga sp. TaxID=2080243 RepID=UPI0025B9D8DD|nr:YHS domain-containing protein [Caldivirga sp.]
MAKHVDPVCGMEVEDTVPFKSLYRGRVYYFCSRHCKEAFDREPEKYLKEGPRGMPNA